MAASLFQRRIGAATDTHIAVARFGTLEETIAAAPYISALLNFAVARLGTMVETMFASQPSSAALSFAPRPIGSPVKGSRQLCCRGVE